MQQQPAQQAQPIPNAQLLFPPPPSYYKLYTNAARNDTSHPNHFVYTPPPPIMGKIPTPYENPEQYTLNQTVDGRLRPFVLLYSVPPHIPPQYLHPTNGALIRFHSDVDYKGELMKLNKLLAQAYAQLPQPASSPQPHERSEAFFFHDHVTTISIIMDNISNLLALLREHQAKMQLLTHFRKQIKLNTDKIARLHALADQASALFNNNLESLESQQQRPS